MIRHPVGRIIDADLNRAKEGLRVCEEVTRFILNDRRSTSELRAIRHALEPVVSSLWLKSELIAGRDSAGDIGRNIQLGETSRRGIEDIFFANIQRVKESLRVLEEFGKLRNVRASLRLKSLRYRVYEVEKRIAQKVASLRGNR